MVDNVIQVRVTEWIRDIEKDLSEHPLPNKNAEFYFGKMMQAMREFELAMLGRITDPSHKAYEDLFPPVAMEPIMEPLKAEQKRIDEDVSRHSKPSDITVDPRPDTNPAGKTPQELKSDDRKLDPPMLHLKDTEHVKKGELKHGDVERGKA